MAEEKKEESMEVWMSAIKEQEEASKGKQDKENKEELGMEVFEKFKRFLDIPLQVEVVVGSTVMNLGELLNLDIGSVVELEQAVEAPVDIRVNGKLVAKGEIVIVEDKFGVRIIDIIGREERIKKVM